MLKVLLVDDDMSARANLRELIDWPREGFVLCGEAANGSAAIKLVEESGPDIVITDMNMPIMDGVAFIGWVARHRPEMKLIALSGYDDFEYVRNSLKSGVVDYLLKHRLDAGTLLAILNQARDAINRERRDSFDRQRNEAHLTIGRTVAVRAFIKRLAGGTIDSREEIEQTIASLRMNLDMKHIVVIVAELDDFALLRDKYSEPELASLSEAFIDIARKAAEGFAKCTVDQLDAGKFILFVSLGQMHSELYMYNQLSEAIGMIRQSMGRQLNLTACFSVSRKCPDIVDVGRYYGEAQQLLRDKFYNGKNTVYWRDADKAQKEAAVFSLGIQDEKELLKLIRAKEGEAAAAFIERLFQQMAAGKSTLKSIQLVCADLINIVNRAAREHGIGIEELYSSEDVPYNKPQQFDTISDIREWLLGVYDSLFVKLGAHPVGKKDNPSCLKAIQYVHQHYKRNISLQDAAAAAGVNASYLSHLFKDEYGIGFVEYLNKVRVDKAKALIDRDALRIKDIVGEVGFNSYNYFFRVFKDSTGMTPLEYKSRTASQK